MSRMRRCSRLWRKEEDERHPQLLPEVPVGRPRAFRAALFAGVDLSSADAVTNHFAERGPARLARG